MPRHRMNYEKPKPAATGCGAAFRIHYFKERIFMNCGIFGNGNNCCWIIIILLVLWFCCCNHNNENECGCNNNNSCGMC